MYNNIDNNRFFNLSFARGSKKNLSRCRHVYKSTPPPLLDLAMIRISKEYVFMRRSLMSNWMMLNKTEALKRCWHPLFSFVEGKMIKNGYKTFNFNMKYTHKRTSKLQFRSYVLLNCFIQNVWNLIVFKMWLIALSWNEVNFKANASI